MEEEEKKWPFYIGALVVFFLCGAGYYFYWQSQANALKDEIQAVVDSIENQSGGKVRVTMEDMVVAGFPFLPKVQLVHSSVVSDVPEKELLEVHSHEITLTPAMVGGDGRYEISWQEPIKVIYGNGYSKFVYKVKRAQAFPVHFSVGEVVKRPERLFAELPKIIEISASCGENRKALSFNMPFVRGMGEFRITDNLYILLKDFVYLIDDALVGKGGCKKSYH